MIDGKGPLVTIVTITFNLIKSGREKVFEQCVESVHGQTYDNVEHLVIDGGSKDGTVKLLEEYSNRGWLKYISEPDTGIYNAMNKGLKMAKGEYIAFLNSDDFYHKNDGIQLSIDALVKSGADFSYAPVRNIKDDGSKLDYDHRHSHPDITHLFFEMPFCHQTMFSKTSLLRVNGGFDEHFKSAADYDLILRSCIAGATNVFVEEVFATFRAGGRSDIEGLESAREVADSYFRNYNKMVKLSRDECAAIYCNDYNNIPDKLAIKLKNYPSYFDYDEYLRTKKQKDLNLQLESSGQSRPFAGSMKNIKAVIIRLTPRFFRPRLRSLYNSIKGIK